MTLKHTYMKSYDFVQAQNNKIGGERMTEIRQVAVGDEIYNVGEISKVMPYNISLQEYIQLQIVEAKDLDHSRRA